MGEIRNGIETSGRIGALSLPTFDLLAGLWGLASSSCFLIELARGLLQGLCQTQDPGAIAMKI